MSWVSATPLPSTRYVRVMHDDNKIAAANKLKASDFNVHYQNFAQARSNRRRLKSNNWLYE
jgi:hypothetical protein